MLSSEVVMLRRSLIVLLIAAVAALVTPVSLNACAMMSGHNRGCCCPNGMAMGLTSAQARHPGVSCECTIGSRPTPKLAAPKALLPPALAAAPAAVVQATTATRSRALERMRPTSVPPIARAQARLCAFLI